MIYLKTYFYAPHEIPFLECNLAEAFPHIDKFIICEYNRTHTGHARNFIFDSLRTESLKSEKVAYFPCDISEETVFADTNERAIHEINEPVMRGYFVKCLQLQDDDIIVSVDADEIIDSRVFPHILDHVRQHGTTLLQLHQFMYKPTYFWKDNQFIAPTAAKYSAFKNRYPAAWRYEGKLFPEVVGCHFSWCMSVDAMIAKLKSYGHPQYRVYADKGVLESAIRDKKYPFDNSLFTIEEKSLSDTMYPYSTKTLLSEGP